MNTEKVFTAFKKTGEEILIYRRKDNTYINLIDNKILPNEEIDLMSLNCIENSLDLSNFLFKNIRREHIKCITAAHHMPAEMRFCRTFTVKRFGI